MADKVELIKDTPQYLHDEHFKIILGEEYCFRAQCEGCPLEPDCQHEDVEVDVAQEPNIRKALVARDGYCIVAIDYSGIEVRIASCLSKEPVWVNAFLSGADMHAETAKVIFGPNFSKLERQMAKCVRRGTKVFFRTFYAEQVPGSKPVGVDVRLVTTPQGKVPLLLDSGTLVLEVSGKEERKLVRDLLVGDFLVDIPSQRPSIKTHRPNTKLGKKSRYLHVGLSLQQIKVLKSRDLDGLIITDLEEDAITLYAIEETKDIDFAFTDLHRTGDFVPFHNLQVWTRNGWQTAAFLFFDGVRDFWTIKVGNLKLQAPDRHLVFAKRGLEEDFIQMQHLNPATDQVLVEENENFVWKDFKLLQPEKLTVKSIRRTEEENRAYKTRDKMFDIVVPAGHEYQANSFTNHNTSNFSNLFGGTAGSLAASANIPIERAKVIWDSWWRALPKLKEWYDQVCSASKVAGYVKTVFGRRRSLKEWYDGQKSDISFANRSAANTQIQGTAADILKRALAALHRYILDHGLQEEVRLLLAIHDEIVFEIRLENLQKHLDWILPIMKQTPKGWPVPLEVDCEIGFSWGDVRNIEELKKANSPLMKYLGVHPTKDTSIDGSVTSDNGHSIKTIPTVVSLDDKRDLCTVYHIDKKLWNRAAVVKMRQALLSLPGQQEIAFDIGGQLFRDPKLPRVDSAKFSAILERIKSEHP